MIIFLFFEQISIFIVRFLFFVCSIRFHLPFLPIISRDQTLLLHELFHLLFRQTELGLSLLSGDKSSLDPQFLVSDLLPLQVTYSLAEVPLLLLFPEPNDLFSSFIGSELPYHAGQSQLDSISVLAVITFIVVVLSIHLLLGTI